MIPMTEKTMNRNLEPAWVIKLEEIIKRKGTENPKRFLHEKYKLADTKE